MDENLDESGSDEAEESLPPSRVRVAKNGGPTAKPSTFEKERARKKRELIARGKAKGFLTYDEINEQMPESLASSHQMDDWLSAFSAEGIESVDSPSKLKGAKE